MTIRKTISHVLLSATLISPLGLAAQTARQHAAAERAQTASDHQHHTGAKIVGGSAAGGAVIGALAGGGKGAVIGGLIGAGGGAVANHVRKQKRVRRRERTGNY